MSITEVGSPAPVEAGITPYENLSYCQTTALMQELVPAGQADLAPADIAVLGQLTDHLVDLRGQEALDEYNRYNEVKDRRLDIPDDLLHEHLGGKVILVNGGTGLIGSALLDTISQYGPARMVSVSRGETPTWKEVEGVEYVTGVDIREKDALKAVIGDVQPDIIYHVAADKYNAEAEKRAKHTLTTNILGVENVIEAAEAAGTPLVVQASTGKATRPYSPDIYASSKKTGELLFAQAVKDGKFTAAAGRFTHVVDDSNLRHKVHEQIDAGGPVRLQSPDVVMYIQSAYESAQLLLASGLEAKAGEFRVQAIRNLDKPVNLADIGLGAVVATSGNTPIYFQGVTEGYEDVAWPHLYGLQNMELSPLVNSIEAHEAVAARSCPEIDSFVLDISETTEVDKTLAALKDAFKSDAEGTSLRELNQDLGWAMLEARIQQLPLEVIEKICKKIERTPDEVQSAIEFARTNQAFIYALKARQAQTIKVGNTAIAAS